MKKKIAALAIVLSMLSIAAMGTLAYFIDVETAHNIITSGNVDIQIVEYQQNENGDWVEYPNEPLEMMPGQTISKIVTIHNLEEYSFVRARIDLLIRDANGAELQLKENMITLTLNEESWSRKEGGDWLYYNKALEAGEASDPLFREVVFDGPTMTNEYQNSTVEVIVYAQAVQAVHNGASALDAEGWPQENFVE